MVLIIPSTQRAKSVPEAKGQDGVAGRRLLSEKIMSGHKAAVFPVHAQNLKLRQGGRGAWSGLALGIY